MRVAIDAIPLVAAKTGVGHYTDALAEWLARTHADHTYELLSPFDFAFTTGKHDGLAAPENLSKKFMPVRSIFRKWWLIGLPSLLYISPVDVFHGTNYCVPVFAPCPTVVTIHDLSLLTQAVTHEDDNVKRGRRRLPIMARRATIIIAPSEWTRREIIEQLNVKPEKIRVVPEAAREKMRPVAPLEAQSVLERHGIRQPYVLYTGTIEPRKNLLTLLRAYDELLRATEHRPQLVLCGGRGWLCDEVFELVAHLKIEEQVRFTGYVEDADLPALYSSAEVFVYPSLYEGFGLPPLEAMACGTPVITSNAASLPEVVGSAGLTVSPREVPALTSSLVNLLSDNAQREHFRRAGLERAAEFSWARAADETQAIYDEVFVNWQRKKQR